MKKKLIGFDLDGTLADSKSPLSDRMAELLNDLLAIYHVCIMSGGRYALFQKQILTRLKSEPDRLKKLHLMPTCGTRYLKYEEGEWRQKYAEDFTDTQKKKIITALNQAIDALGFREKQTWGEIIEDRGSQITFSALGQDVVETLGQEGLKKKEAWDPDGSKKAKLRDYIAELLPDFEARAGGTTSIDITKQGIDKAYGMKKLMAELDLKKEDILFIGDKMQPGGNDYPVKLMGIDAIEIRHWQETALVIEAIILVS
jgi:phosphomannomutase